MDRVPQPDASVVALGRFLARALIHGVVMNLVLIGALLAGLFAACSVARAEPCAWAVMTVGSKHIGGDRNKDYNEENWGLGGEHCVGKLFGLDVRGAAGFFRNSNRIDSFYLGGSVTLFELGPVKLGAALLRVSGYEIDPITALFPVLAIEGERLGVNISAFPKSRSTASAVGFQVKARWR